MFHLSAVEEQQAAFQKDKDILNTLDHDLTFQKSASYLYLTSTSKYIGALLAQKSGGGWAPNLLFEQVLSIC